MPLSRLQTELYRCVCGVCFCVCAFVCVCLFVRFCVDMSVCDFQRASVTFAQRNIQVCVRGGQGVCLCVYT